MIQITNLNKTYNSKKKKECEALKCINLNIQDKGLVFILGKSGSGKSTLLNLIGGLDNITSGSIIVDGNDLSKFKEKDFCRYRNNHVGFIFQDYHLIEELSVYENIALSLNLVKEEDKGKISEALARVELSGYETRFPHELSGGERQRVAIARAIVKKPSIILADEPTGNLDTATSTAIIALLKELSKDCLILIVSHNVIDAYKYADRIIELSLGNVIKDVTRNIDFNDSINIDDNVLYLPDEHNLNDEDVLLINKELNSNNIKKVVKVKDKYLETKTDFKEEEPKKISKKNLSLKNLIKLCFRFLKTKIARIVFSSLIVSVIMLIFALAETIVMFDGGKVLTNEMKKNDLQSVLLFKELSEDEKAIASKDYVKEIDEGDVNKFYEAGYKGNIIEVLNYNIPITTTLSFVGYNESLLIDGIYLKETLGTLTVTEDFFIDKLGKCEYLAKADEFHPNSFIITDYVADAIIKHGDLGSGKGATYEELIGEYVYDGCIRLYIDGIINTGYKEKHKDILKEIGGGFSLSKLAKYYEDERFISLTNDIYSLLGYSYTYNENLIQDAINSDIPDVLYHHQLTFNGIPVSFDNTLCVRPNVDFSTLQDNEIIMPYEKYNKAFGTNYTSSNLNTFVPHEFELAQYRFYDYALEEPLLKMTVKIVGIHNKSGLNSTLYVGDNVYDAFKPNNYFAKGLYFDGNEGIDKVFDLCEELEYVQQIVAVDAIHTMTKAVDVFIPIFKLIAVVLCVGIIAILVSFSSKMVKDKYHDIGIMKALGSNNLSIVSIFGLQILLIIIVTGIFSSIGYYFFIGLANDILVESLIILAPSHVMLNIDFLTFDISICLINMVIIFVLGLVSLIIPMIKIMKIKPVKIIKVKE